MPPLMQGVDPASLNGRIVECSWDPAAQRWMFMRVREDKDRPNASHVYEKASF